MKTTTVHLTAMGIYQIRHAGNTARQAAGDIAGLLDLGITLVDISCHDRQADTITLHAHIEETGHDH